MSEAHIEKFYEIASRDRALFAEMLNGTDGPEAFISNVVEKAKERGFEFSHEEASAWIQKQQEIKANGELSDAQLESVAGGKGVQGVDLNISWGETTIDISEQASAFFDSVVEWATEAAHTASGSSDPNVAAAGSIVSNWFSSW
jgi:hypothetical protein